MNPKINEEQALREHLKGILAWSTPKPRDGEVYKDDRLNELMKLIVSREASAAHDAASACVRAAEWQTKRARALYHADFSRGALGVQCSLWKEPLEEAVDAIRSAAQPYLKRD